MKKIYRVLREAVQAVINVMDAFTPVWSSSVAMGAAVDALNGKAAELDQAEAVQKVQIKGFTKEKYDKKFIMANLGVDMSKRVRAYASVIGNIPLFGQMDFSFSKLYFANSNLAKQLAQNIYDAAGAVPEPDQEMYGIDTALPLFLSSIEKYTSVITAPRDRSVIREAATKKISDVVKEIRIVLDDRVGFLMSNYRESNPDFYNQFIAAREELNRVRHTTIEGTVTDLDSGADLKAVKVTITAPGKLFEDMTDVQGKFKQQELNPELDYIVTFELPQYEPFTATVDDLKPGGHERISVKLKKIA